jgi:hypothetical protein
MHFVWQQFFAVFKRERERENEKRFAASCIDVNSIRHVTQAVLPENKA